LLLLLSGKVVANSSDVEEETPLLWAARNRHGSIVEILVNHGAEVDSRDSNGQTALSWA
jgi:ankyrin repeat protein